jgi:RND family efflux transporter MFP subunit
VEEIAVADLDQEIRGLKDVEEGADPLTRQKLEAAAQVAQANLRSSQKALADILAKANPKASDPATNNAAADPRNLTTAADARTAIVAGADPLQVSLRVSEVANAIASLIEAEKDVTDLIGGPDPLELAVKERETALALATLDEAIDDLEELTEDIDPLEVRHKQALVTVADAQLREAQTRLQAIRELIPLEIALRRADVTLAREVTRNALEDFEEAVIRAPFDGTISLVNVEADDEVDKNSRVVEIVDPTVVEVGSLVDAEERQRISSGATATIQVDSLGGQILAGTVSFVADSPKTDRGVIRYPVTIQVDVPDDLQIPLTLSGVSVVVTEERRGVLKVPPEAIQGSAHAPIVLVMKNGAIEKRPVVLGNRDDFWVAVLAGLEEGERVVV